MNNLNKIIDILESEEADISNPTKCRQALSRSGGYSLIGVFNTYYTQIKEMMLCAA